MSKNFISNTLLATILLLPTTAIVFIFIISNHLNQQDEYEYRYSTSVAKRLYVNGENGELNKGFGHNVVYRVLENYTPVEIHSLSFEDCLVNLKILKKNCGIGGFKDIDSIQMEMYLTSIRMQSLRPSD